MLKSTNKIAGLFFATVGAVWLLVSLQYDMGSTTRMGPGYFPVSLCSILFGLGVLIFLFDEDDEKLSFSVKEELKPLLAICGSIVLFAFLLPLLGVIISIPIAVFVSSLAGDRFSLVRVIMISVALAAICSLLFVYALEIPFPIWPRIPGWN